MSKSVDFMPDLPKNGKIVEENEKLSIKSS